MGLELSKKEIVKEIVKSGKDPVYFINNYGKESEGNDEEPSRLDSYHRYLHR